MIWKASSRVLIISLQSIAIITISVSLFRWGKISKEGINFYKGIIEIIIFCAAIYSIEKTNNLY